MNRDEALQILGLPADASFEKIEKRYELFVRQNKSLQTTSAQKNTSVDNRSVDMEQIGEAYRFLKSSSIAIHEDEQPHKESKALKKLGIDENKLRNNIYYYKWHVLILAVVIAITTFFVVEQVRKVKPEAYIAVIGTYPAFTASQEQFEAELLASAPEIRAVSVDFALELSGDDEYTEFGMGMQMKKMILLSAADVDLYICDMDIFNRFVEEGIFIEIDGMIQENNITVKEESLVLYQTETFGIKVPNDTIFEPMFGSDAEVILCLPARVKNIEKAGVVMKTLAEMPAHISGNAK